MHQSRLNRPRFSADGGEWAGNSGLLLPNPRMQLISAARPDAVKHDPPVVVQWNVG